MSDFTTTVKTIVTGIPPGSTMTYKQVAETAGNPKAARAVANIMAANYDQNIPCHRVIRSDGALGGYNRGGVRAKAKILAAEGVVL
jgi:O-6-methylguanine DNA methyltransferase